MEHHCKHPPNAHQVVVPLVRRDSIGTSHHVLTFEFDTPLDADAGQFAMVRGVAWGESPFLPRPMSLLSAGKRPSLLVKVVGEGSRRLATSQPGDLFTILAPLGRPWSPCPEDRVPVLVAGGVGICPLLFLARTLVAAGRKPLGLYGGRSAADLALEDEMREATDLRVTTDDGSAGRQGLITAELERAIAETEGRAKIYTCGPEAMMARVVELAKRAGVPCEVSLETVMGCGYGACLGCAVPAAGGGFLYACSDGACIDGYAVKWEK